METCLLMVTCPDRKTAEGIARRLVAGSLAACGNVTAPVTSVYRWKGKVRREAEVMLLLKTRKSLVGACVKAIRGAHPYELPEIIALPIVGGLKGYLAWIGAETGGVVPPSRGGPGRMNPL